jgi:hypothetical protein
MSCQTITRTYKKKVTHTKDWPFISGKKKVITRQNESKRFSITSKSESACIGV